MPVCHVTLHVFKTLLKHSITEKTARVVLFRLIQLFVHCRRLLEQPGSGAASRNDFPSPTQFSNNERDYKHTEDSSVGRRKCMQENKQSERETELLGKEPVDRKEVKSDLMDRIERSSFTQQEISDVTKRKNKEDRERTAGNGAAIVTRPRNKDADETELATSPESRLRKFGDVREAEKSLKASLQFSVAKRRDSSGERDSGVSEGSCSEGRQNLATSLVPREDDSLLHGSSELMLVLLPQTMDRHSARGNVNVILVMRWWCMGGVWANGLRG